MIQGSTADRSLMRVSLVQGETRWHDPDGNRRYYGDLLNTLVGRTDLVVMPETFTSGFSNEALGSAEGIDGPTTDWLRACALRVGAAVCGSIQCRTDEGVFNRFVWAQPDGVFAHYDKRHLFRMAGEHERYRAGAGAITLHWRGWRIRPLVCYDLRFPVFSRNRHGHEVATGFDYDLLLCVANWPAARRLAWRTLLAARAIENWSYCVGVNRVGTDGNGIAYSGDSMVIDFLGQSLVDCGPVEQFATVNLDPALLHEHRERFPAWRDADEFELIY